MLNQWRSKTIKSIGLILKLAIDWFMITSKIAWLVQSKISQFKVFLSTEQSDCGHIEQLFCYLPKVFETCHAH